MAALVQALDNFTPVRLGENGHSEFDWSNDLQEKIVQFDFQCIRTTPDGISALAGVLDDLLQMLSVKKASDAEEKKRKDLLTVLYKLIGKTRDIEGGKGEYAISYMMIWTWYKHFPGLSAIALALFVFPPKRLTALISENVYRNYCAWKECFTKDDQIPYGSWKDIKHFCKYVLDQSGDQNHLLIEQCVCFMNTQLSADRLLYGSADPDKKDIPISLAAKWVPRAGKPGRGSTFNWLNKKLALGFYPEYIASAVANGGSKTRSAAEKKCLTQYRILVSTLNRHLDTVQIKQAANRWAEIDHSKTTSITMTKNRRAFMNLPRTKGGDEARSEDPDRIACAENLRAYLEKLKATGKEVKGKNVGLEKFAAEARSLFHTNNQEEKDILNSQWRDNCNKKNADGLGPMIAMVDMSGSMDGDPMNAAIALGCRVAEKSILGKRVLTFSSQPEWINLEGADTFTDMVNAIWNKSNTAGMSTNFHAALDMILTAIEERRVPPAEVENMVLAIFSDMQIDDSLHIQNNGHNYNPNEAQKVAARGKWATLYDQIKQKYAAVGMRLYGQPLNPPHILFWNLRFTAGFPVLSTEANCSMMSGFDPTVLNLFCEQGMEALKNLSPFGNLIKQLDNERYLPLEAAIVYGDNAI